MTSHKLTCRCDRRCLVTWASKNKLLVITAVGIVVGIVLGAAIRPANPSKSTIQWIAIWGDLFLRMLKMVILPIIVSSLVVGIASLNGKASGKMGILAFVFVIGTNTIGSIIGILLAVAIHPGTQFGDTISITRKASASQGDAFLDLLRNLVPENLIQACFQQLQTQVKEVEVNASANITEVVKSLEYINGMNIIGIITFSIALGITIASSGEKGRPLYQMFNSLHHVIFKMMMAITWYSPVGIASMIAGSILRVKDFASVFQALGLFTVTVVVAIIVYKFIVIPLVIFAVIRSNPFRIYWNSLEAIFLAIAPPSSMAGMPGLFHAMEEKLNVDKRVTKFFIPLAVTLIRCGSSIYICAGTIFVAQTYGINVGVGQLFIIGLLVSVLSCAVAAVPSSSLLILMMVSSAVDVPVSDRIGLLLSMEWLLDRVRTSANVATQAYGCMVLYKFCKKDLNDNTQLGDFGTEYRTENDETAEETKTNPQKTSLVNDAHV